MAGDQHFHVRPCCFVGVLAIDQNFLDLTCVQIADRAFDQVSFFMDHRWRLRLQRATADVIPQF